jgi:hypothetical protein
MENSSQMGRIYKVKWRWSVFPVFLLALGSYTTVELLTGALQPTRRFGMFSSASLLLGGGLFTAAGFSSRIIITDDAIEKRNMFLKNRLLLSEIRGRRESLSANWLSVTDTWKLEPKDSKARPIEISSSFNLDEVFYTWMDQIPDLDEDDVSDPCA